MEGFGVVNVAAITVICFLAAQGVKAVGLDPKWLPILCGVLGAILGVVGMYTMPDFPAKDIMTAIAIGIASGLASTGAHQIYKQLRNPDENSELPDDAKKFGKNEKPEPPKL